MLNSNTNLIGNARGLPFSKRFALAYQKRVIADGGTIESLNCVINSRAILQRANLLFIPSGYKAGVAYSELPNNANGDLTWSRNSTANRTQSNGNIGSVGANVPRLSYMYGSCPAALLEPQRTNLITQSNNFTTNTIAAVTLTPNSITSPIDGVLGTTINVGVDASSVRHRILFSMAITSGVTYTFSGYFKKADSQWIQLVAQSASTFDVTSWANFNLDTGTTGTIASTTTARITDVGNGWYRCSITITATGTATGTFEILLTNNTNSGRYPTYQNLTAQNYCYMVQMQVEIGSYPTTPIFTSGATATRIADTFTRNNIYTNGLISASGGTWYVELNGIQSLQRDNSGPIGIGDTLGLLNNALRFFRPSNGSMQIVKYISASLTTLYTLPIGSAKIAIKWNGSTADVFVNGVKVVSATAFTTTIMEFFTGSSGTPTFIQAMALYNTPLSDSDCITLTT